MTTCGTRCCACVSLLIASTFSCFATFAASRLNPARLVSFASAVVMAAVMSSLLPFSYCMSANRALPATQMSPRIVTTQYGKLRGLIVYRPSSGNDAVSTGFGATTGTKQVPVEQFFGLQYASTLGSELRFMPPTGSMEKWEGTRIALKHRPVCPQPVPDLLALSRRLPRGRVEHFQRLAAFVDKQTEDCLSLNIYVPFYVPDGGLQSHHLSCYKINAEIKRYFHVFGVYELSGTTWKKSESENQDGGQYFRFTGRRHEL